MKRMTGFSGVKQPLLMAVMLGMSCSVSAAELWYEAGEVDKSEWVCKYCPDYTGLNGEISAGIGYVTDDEYAFGNYTGLDEEGTYGVLGADLFYRGEDGNYWNLNATRLGLDTRSVRIEGGRQGSYRATVDYLEIPRLYSDSAMTPFLGVGGDNLQLPSSWVEAGTTDAMTELDNSLRTVELRTDRRRLGVGLNFKPTERWSYTVNFKRDRKEGLKDIGGSFLFRGTLLPEPVDYTTDQMELGVGYRADRWQVQLDYLGSFFKNEHDRLRWDNPFIEPVGNANEGQMALPPDNTFHQLALSGNYRFTDATQATARLAAGQMLQNEDFLPYTVNPSLTTSALPRDSLDGEVRTLTFDARLVSAVTERLTLQADLGYDERDDQTSVDSFDIVSTDAFLPGARENRIYDHRNSSLGLQGRYRMTSNSRLSAGADYERKERPEQEVEETKETTLWVEASTRLHPTSDLVLKVARADRDASDYQTLASTTEPQNPLLMKFNMASREQLRTDVRLHFSPQERLDFGLNLAYSNNDYTDTSVGLRESRDTSATFDAMLLVSHSLSFHAFATQEKHENDQAGSQNFSVPDWFATSEDVIASYGLGADWRPSESDFEFGVDYVYSKATGKIDLRGETGFPDLENRIHSANAHVRYNFSEKLSTSLGLFYERFESEEWMVDGIEPDTIPQVLTLGTESPDYRNRAIALVLHYRL